MKVTVILVMIGALGTILKGQVTEMEKLGIREGAGSIETTAVLRSARILKRVLETQVDLLSPRIP